MSDDLILERQADYLVPLLRLLSGLPGGQGRASEVLRLFESKYRNLIPEEHYEPFDEYQLMWQRHLHWSRFHLKNYGLLDAPGYGIWRITDAGRQWLKDNPNARRIKAQGRRGPRRSRRRSSKVALAPGISLEMLEQTRKLMPADQFRQLWGTLYDQLLAEERAKAVTEITQTELGSSCPPADGRDTRFPERQECEHTICRSALRLDPLLLHS